MTLKEWQELRALDQLADTLHNSSRTLAERLDRLGDHLMTLRGRPEEPKGAHSSRVNNSAGVIDYFDQAGSHIKNVQVVNGRSSGMQASAEDLKELSEIIGELGKLKEGLEAVKVSLMENIPLRMGAAS